PRGNLPLAPRSGKYLQNLDDPVALGEHFVVGAIGGFEVDLAAQRVAWTDIELAAIEFVEQGPRLAISDRSRVAVLQRPLPTCLIVGHFDDEDHIRRMIDE